MDRYLSTKILATALIILAAIPAGSQQTIAPFKTSQGNTDLYVKMGAGSTYTTIQKTVTAACGISGGATVVILPGANPPDTIGAAHGCNGVGIIDRSALPMQTYQWQSTQYVNVSPGGSGGTGSVLAGTAQLLSGYQTDGTTVGPTQASAYYAAQLLQGWINPDYFSTGGGNTNGLGNVLASALCASLPCAALTVPNSTSTEFLPQYVAGANASSPGATTGTVVGTTQGGQQLRIFQDPASPASFTNGGIGRNSESDVTYFTEPTPAGITFPTFGRAAPVIEMLSGGYDEFIPGFTPNFKSNYYDRGAQVNKYTSGQLNALGENVTAPGQGDEIAIAATVTSAGGTSGDLTDEGSALLRLQAQEDLQLELSDVAASGSNTVTLMTLTANPMLGDEGHIEDWANPITSQAQGCIITDSTEQGNPSPSVTFTNAPGQTCTVPDSWMGISAGRLIAGGSYPRAAAGTVSVLILTSAVPAGWNTSTAGIPNTGTACISDVAAGVTPDYFETVPYTVTDSDHFTMTFLRPHPQPVVIGIGAMCNKLLVPSGHVYGTVASIPTSGTNHQAIMMIGAKANVGYLGDGARTTPIYQHDQNGEGEVMYYTASIATLSRTSNVVTAVIPGFVPAAGANLVMSFAGASDSSFDAACPLIAIVDSQTFTCGQTGANSTATGGTATVNNATYTIVPAAKILHAMNPATKAISGLITLYPTTWTVTNGDPLVFPHGSNLVTTFAPNSLVGQELPPPDFGNSAGGGGGFQLTRNMRPGPTAGWWGAVNSAPANTYWRYGGTKNLPDAFFYGLGPTKWDGEFASGAFGGFAFHAGINGPGAVQIFNEFDLNGGGTAQFQFNPNTGQLRWSCSRGPNSGNCAVSVNGGDITYDPTTTAMSFENETSHAYFGLQAAYLNVIGGTGALTGVNLAPGSDPTVKGAKLCSTTLNVARLGTTGQCDSTGTLILTELDALTTLTQDGNPVCTAANGLCDPPVTVFHGLANLVAGTVTVTSAQAINPSASHGYQLANCGAGGTVGILSVGTTTPGTSFVINSNSALDTSDICWTIY